MLMILIFLFVLTNTACTSSHNIHSDIQEKITLLESHECRAQREARIEHIDHFTPLSSWNMTDCTVNYPMQKGLTSFIYGSKGEFESVKIVNEDFLYYFFHNSDLLNILDKAQIPKNSWMRQLSSYMQTPIPEPFQFPNCQYWGGFLKMLLVGSKIAQQNAETRQENATQSYMSSLNILDQYMVYSKKTQFLEAMAVLKLLVQSTNLTPAVSVQDDVICPMESWVNYVSEGILPLGATPHLHAVADYGTHPYDTFDYFIKGILLPQIENLESELLNQSVFSVNNASPASIKCKVIQDIVQKHSAELLPSDTQIYLQKVNPELLMFLMAYSAGFSPVYAGCGLAGYFAQKRDFARIIRADFLKNVWIPTSATLEQPPLETLNIPSAMQEEWCDGNMDSDPLSLLQRIKEYTLEVGINLEEPIEQLKKHAPHIHFRVSNTLSCLLLHYDSYTHKLLLFLPRKSALKKENALLVKYFLTENVNYWRVIHTQMPGTIKLRSLIIGLSTQIRLSVKAIPTPSFCLPPSSAQDILRPSWFKNLRELVKSELDKVLALQETGAMQSPDEWASEETFRIVQEMNASGFSAFDDATLVGMLGAIRNSIVLQKLHQACLQQYAPTPKVFHDKVRQLFSGTNPTFPNRNACLMALEQVIALENDSAVKGIAPNNPAFYGGWKLLAKFVQSEHTPETLSLTKKHRSIKMNFVTACYLLHQMLNPDSSITQDFCAKVIDHPPFALYELDKSQIALDSASQAIQKLKAVGFLSEAGKIARFYAPLPSFCFTKSSSAIGYQPVEKFCAFNTLSLFEAMSGVSFENLIKSNFQYSPGYRLVTNDFPQPGDILVLIYFNDDIPDHPINLPFPGIVVRCHHDDGIVWLLHSPYKNADNKLYSYGYAGPGVYAVKAAFDRHGNMVFLKRPSFYLDAKILRPIAANTQ